MYSYIFNLYLFIINQKEVKERFIKLTITNGDLDLIQKKTYFLICINAEQKVLNFDYKVFIKI